jgi:hypothetical protein
MSTSQKVSLVIVSASVIFLFAAGFGFLPGLIAMAVAIVRFAIRTAMLWALVVVTGRTAHTARLNRAAPPRSNLRHSDLPSAWPTIS